MKNPIQGIFSKMWNVVVGSAAILLPAGGIGFIVTKIQGAIVNAVSNEIFAGVTIIFAALMMVAALALHKGKEDTLALLPTLMTVIGLTAIVSTFLPASLAIISFAADLTTIHGFALAISEVLLALAIVEMTPLVKFVKFKELASQKSK